MAHDLTSPGAMPAGSTVPPSGPRIHTVVLQPTPFCNIDCRYCYLPQRSATSTMSLDTIVAAFREIFSSGMAATHITVIWHAGEPLVLPVSYYQAAFDAIEALRPPSIALRHSFQTNGTLISTQWCDFFKQWQVGVGVSIDGPRAIHDANRVTRSGAGTFDRAIAGVRLLRREQVPFHVISVLSESGMSAPETLLDFYISEGIEDVCFNVEESEGDHVSTLFDAADPRQRFRIFLNRFWTLSRQSGRIRFLREIDGMISRIFRPEDAPVENAQVEPFSMLNIDCHGNVSSFSPELLGYKNAAYNDFIVGNILTESLGTMLHSAPMEAMSRDIAAGVEACRATCDYFSVCGGGAPVNKLSENGTFASTTTSFCTLVQMVPTDLILEAMDHLDADFARIPTRTHSPLDRFRGDPAPLQPAVPGTPPAHDLPLIQIQRGTR